MECEIGIGEERLPGPQDSLILEFKAGAGFRREGALAHLADIGIDELCLLAGERFKAVAESSGARAEDFSDPKLRLVWVNGWQSWSFAGELARGERPRRAVLKRELNLFADHPAEAEILKRARARAAVVSHFAAVIRVGAARLALVSLGGGACPPAVFYVSRASVGIEVHSEGGTVGAGDTLARIAVFAADGYFDLKRGLERLFGVSERSSSPVGFETWYESYTDIDEARLREDMDAFGKTANLPMAMAEAGLTGGAAPVFQIDDGWEAGVGDWRADPGRFPSGMAAAASAIRAAGCAPGIWLAPFLVLPGSAREPLKPEWILRGADGSPVLAAWNPNWGGRCHCLDISREDVAEYLESLVARLVGDWGFSYLKLDFLYAGMLGGRRSDPRIPSWRRYVDILARMARAARSAGQARGSDRAEVELLACGAPIELTRAILPFMRIGADTREHWEWPLLRLIGHQGRPSARVNLSHNLGRAILAGTGIRPDPDVVFCRNRGSSLADSEKYLIGLTARMFGRQIMISDRPSLFGRDNGKGGDRESEEAFTRSLVRYYGYLEGKEYGAERFSHSSPNLFRFFSGDGEIKGFINLSDSNALIQPDEGAGMGKIAVPRRSIMLFGLPT